MSITIDLIVKVVFAIIVIISILLFICKEPLKRLYYRYLGERRINKLLFYFIIYVIPIIGCIGVTIPFVIGEYSLSILGLYLALPMILGPIVFWIYFYRHGDKTVDICTEE
jgi:membrane protease YdiL (CAAX protease family)